MKTEKELCTYLVGDKQRERMDKDEYRLQQTVFPCSCPPFDNKLHEINDTKSNCETSNRLDDDRDEIITSTYKYIKYKIWECYGLFNE